MSTRFRRRSSRATRDTSTRVIAARFPGKCAESGERFAAGDSILYVGASRSCYRLESAAAVAWFDAQPAFDVPSDEFDMAYEDACRDRCGL